MAVVLIGSTGNGKSTLGNFLIDPSEEHVFRDQSFSTARDNKPHTQHVKSKEVVPKCQSSTIPLTIIDTPGLNETPEKDLEHMIDIIKKLQSVGNIQACLFVVKFSTKIDAQYRATVRYYAKLLPTLFERNTAIIMTDFATDPRSIKQREMQGINVEQVKDNVVCEITESGGLHYTPSLFTIDCMPMDQSETETNMKVRDSLLKYICDQTPVSLESMKVAKPAHLKLQDDKEIEYLEGEIGGYNQRLKKMKKSAERVLTEVEATERAITNMEKQLQPHEEELREKDTDDPMIIRNWTVNVEWKALRTLSKEFDLDSNYRITDVKKWTSGEDVKWKDYDESNYRVKGTVAGKFMRGLYASLELKTKKRERFREEIKDIRIKMENLTRELNTFKKERKKFNAERSEHAEEIEELVKYIEEKRKKILKLAEDTMTIDEAIKRRDEGK